MGAYLDRPLVLFVVEGHVGWVETEEVPHLVGNGSAHAFVAAIAEPNLDQSFFGPQ